MPKYSQREQYVEQQLQSLKDSQGEFKTIVQEMWQKSKKNPDCEGSWDF